MSLPENTIQEVTALTGNDNELFTVVWRPKDYEPEKQKQCWYVATTGANRAEAITTDYKRARAVSRGIKTFLNKRYPNGIEVRILKSYIKNTKVVADNAR